MSKAKVNLGSVHPTWRRLIAAGIDNIPSKILKESVVPSEDLFRAFEYFGYLKTKVVLIGQDPYPAPGKANGLCFGLSKEWIAKTGGKDASSFGNIIREIESDPDLAIPGADIGVNTVQDLTLEAWAMQGVLMLNTRLTVAPNKPLSHTGVGWEEITGSVVKLLAERSTPLVFIVLGAEARKFVRKYVKKGSPHVVLATSHPCRYSADRGFIGSHIFSRANNALMSFGEEPIDWCAPIVRSIWE